MTPDDVARLAASELERARNHPLRAPEPEAEKPRHPEILAIRDTASVGTTLILATESVSRSDPRLYLFHFDLRDWPGDDLLSAGGGVFEVLMRCTETMGWRDAAIPVSTGVAIVPVSTDAYRLAGMLTPTNSL